MAMTAPFSRINMGALPATGRSGCNCPCRPVKVGLEGSSLNGMAFTLYGGKATWDYCPARHRKAATIQ